VLALRARLAEIEEHLRRESERGGEQRGGELLDGGVVLQHRIVEEAASADCEKSSKMDGRQPKC
jgi:hypothetical protein